MTWDTLTTKAMYPARATSSHPMTPVYDYTKIRAHWDELPEIRIRYTSEETGWAKYLSPQHACLANISTTTDLRLYDIVEIDQTDDQALLPFVGDRLQAYYAHTLQIQYHKGKTEQETFDFFQIIYRIFQEVDGVTESMMPGFALANVPSQCAMQALLEFLNSHPGVQASVIHYESDDE